MPLINDEENDYTLPEGEKSCWITVDGLSIYIVRNSDTNSVRVDIYEELKEMDDPLDSMEVLTRKHDTKKED